VNSPPLRKETKRRQGGEGRTSNREETKMEFYSLNRGKWSNIEGGGDERNIETGLGEQGRSLKVRRESRQERGDRTGKKSAVACKPSIVTPVERVGGGQEGEKGRTIGGWRGENGFENLSVRKEGSKSEENPGQKGGERLSQ